MDLFIFLLITHTLINYTHGSDADLTEAIGLDIQPEMTSHGHNTLTRRAEETLNLTCSIVSNMIAPSVPRYRDNMLARHKLSWHLPHLIQQNSQNRVSESEEYPNSRVLTIQNLKESDTGDYECRARLDGDNEELVFNKTVRLNVKNRKGICGDQMFMCTAGNCIMRRFLCDGRRDCKSGTDEDEQHCGPSPCEGKLWCPDDRCIPLQWCCDKDSEANCTVKTKPACCQRLVTGGGYLPSPDFTDMSDQQRFSDMGFLQTTIYTVIGCAMAFMFIVTILVIAICRVHMKRSLLSRCPNAAGASRGRGVRGAPQPLYDLDVFLNRATFPPETAPHSGLLVTYNINNGIQFVGRPVDPPPYCEVVDSPPREGPPPPYTSRENLQQDARQACASTPAEYEPLLTTTENVTGNTLRITVVNAVPPRATIRATSAARACASRRSVSPSLPEESEEAKPQSPSDISRHDDLTTQE